MELGSEAAVLKFILHGANADQWTQGLPEKSQEQFTSLSSHPSRDSSFSDWFGSSVSSESPGLRWKFEFESERQKNPR